jgi:hypothetical protein
MSRAETAADVDAPSAETGDEPPVRDLSAREARALSEHIVVLPPRLAPRYDAQSGLFSVTGENGSTYTVDPLLGSCTCPDARHHDPDGGCKHVARVEFELGEREVPDYVDEADVAHFCEFVGPCAE